MNTQEAVQAVQKIEPQPIPHTVESMIVLAIERGATVETLERLMAIRREVRAERAKEAFDRALAAFQSECPIIEKTKAVPTRSGQVAYRYAPIESIVAQVKGLLKTHGLSYSARMDLMQTGVKAIVKVTHEAGHSEESAMEVPFGNKTEIMSQTQVVAAATTFAKRYAFCNAFGILTGDEDTDAAPAKEPAKTPQDAPRAAAPGQASAQPNKTPSRPKSAQAVAAAVPGVEVGMPSQEQKDRWIKMLEPLGDWAKAYGIEKGWILPPSEQLSDMNLSWQCIPRTKAIAKAWLAEIQERVDGQK